MAKYRVKTTLFCSISKEAKWQDWLTSVSPDLGQELLAHLKESRSCRANNQKMREIQERLVKRGVGSRLLQFLQVEFPFAIEIIDKPIQHKTMQALPMSDTVFEFYDPHLLSFPQKMVLKNESLEALRQSVMEFCVGKVGVDYLIIGDAAYIEYFKLKYAIEAEQISLVEREIYKYRLRRKIPRDKKEIGKDNL